MAAGGRVTQRLADRIALAVVPAGAHETLIERSDVLNVFDEDVPEAAVEDLDEAERIFVDAWRKRARPKDRTGDGMRWDAPGFEAP